MVEASGRRERKKAETRQGIADAALELFIARGFASVSIREIAEAADVSIATLYAHFPSKEALVFDEDDAIRDTLLDAVRSRPESELVIDAVHRWMLGFVSQSHQYESDPDGHFAAFLGLIASTQSLREYERGMWDRIATELAATIASELGKPADDPTIAAFAHFVMETWTLLDHAGAPDAQVEAVFALLRPGWERFELG